MKDVLLDYRIHDQNVSVIHTANQLSTQNTIRIKIAEHYGLTLNTSKEVKEYLSFLLVMKPQPHQESSVELSGDCGIFLTLLDNLKILSKNSHNEVITKNILRAIQQIVPLFCGFRWKDFRAILNHLSAKKPLQEMDPVFGTPPNAFWECVMTSIKSYPSAMIRKEYWGATNGIRRR